MSYICSKFQKSYTPPAPGIGLKELNHFDESFPLLETGSSFQNDDFCLGIGIKSQNCYG